MKWALIVLGILVGIVALIAAIGAILPVSHVATRVARYNQPPDAIWAAITDIEAMPAWRSGLKSIKRLPRPEGRLAWVETSDFGEMPLEVEEFNPPQRMVCRIADPNLPFGGTWTYEVAPFEGGSTLRITENGEIHNVFFRFMARFIFGYQDTLETYLKDLGKKLGETFVMSP